MPDPRAVAPWLISRSTRDGGGFRFSLTHEEPTAAGKTTATPTPNGAGSSSFLPDERVVRVVAFETDDPALGEEMTVTSCLADVAVGVDGTGLLAVHDNVPEGVSSAADERGGRMSLAKLAALFEEASEPLNQGHARVIPWSCFEPVSRTHRRGVEPSIEPGRPRLTRGRRCRSGSPTFAALAMLLPSVHRGWGKSEGGSGRARVERRDQGVGATGP